MDKELIKWLMRTTKALKYLDKYIGRTAIDYLNRNLNIDNDGKVKNTPENVSILQGLKGSGSRLAATIMNALKSIFTRTAKDISKHNPDVLDISDPIIKLMLNHAATTTNRIADLEIVYSSIKETMLQMMSKPGGATLNEMREVLADKVKGNALATKYYQRWTHDILFQYQRYAANELRKKAGLTHAIYQGGIIETSRSFCNQKNDQVFTEKEIMSWVKEDWKGKPEIGYDPIADMGGYNCRHYYDWISDRLAKQLRPDLK